MKENIKESTEKDFSHLNNIGSITIYMIISYAFLLFFYDSIPFANYIVFLPIAVGLVYIVHLLSKKGVSKYYQIIRRSEKKGTNRNEYYVVQFTYNIFEEKIYWTDEKSFESFEKAKFYFDSKTSEKIIIEEKL
ncbi:hypothetical protein HN014_22325 (plasmid) [Aquimarina sp. TRL1]|uniref:hypothetical protein n=1 Tax=Aquimarina sp. (strain TRL1) TaxID=2736252 RepID=UPI00158E0235|nr:hypothetical protein [Aquimarina sp. TRL1]QKX07739.1 hypothetical protein HN014_22325 [Aquimarina sp. TRL1]